MNQHNASSSHITVVIIDDHPLIRAGIKQSLQTHDSISIIGEAISVAEAKLLIPQTMPHIILLDLNLSDGSGFDILKWMVAEDLNIPVLVISMYEDSAYIKKAFQHGAKGYLFKRDSTTHVVHAIQKVLDGKRYTSESASEQLLDDLVNPVIEPLQHIQEIFSNREFEVYQLLGQGLSRKEVAAKLSISPNTVESHIERMRTKLNVQSSTQLIYSAIRNFNTSQQ